MGKPSVGGLANPSFSRVVQGMQMQLPKALAGEGGRAEPQLVRTRSTHGRSLRCSSGMGGEERRGW